MNHILIGEKNLASQLDDKLLRKHFPCQQVPDFYIFERKYLFRTELRRKKLKKLNKSQVSI